jgi:hypothetical protein
MEVGTSNSYTAVPSMPLVRHSTCTWETQSIFRFYPVGIKGKKCIQLHLCKYCQTVFKKGTEPSVHCFPPLPIFKQGFMLHLPPPRYHCVGEMLRSSPGLLRL